MRFTFTVEVEVARTQGKFATRDELADQLREAIEGADPGSLQGEGEGEYETTEWSVNDTSNDKPVKPPKKQRATPSTVGSGDADAVPRDPHGASGPTS